MCPPNDDDVIHNHKEGKMAMAEIVYTCSWPLAYRQLKANIVTAFKMRSSCRYSRPSVWLETCHRSQHRQDTMITRHTTGQLHTIVSAASFYRFEVVLVHAISWSDMLVAQIKRISSNVRAERHLEMPSKSPLHAASYYM